MFLLWLTKWLDKDNFFNVVVLLIIPNDFKPIVMPKIASDNITIAPDGVMLTKYEIIIPIITEEIANEIESNVVCLKLRPNIIAVTFGITNKAEIRNIPTNWIEVTTVIPAMNTIR